MAFLGTVTKKLSGIKESFGILTDQVDNEGKAVSRHDLQKLRVVVDELMLKSSARSAGEQYEESDLIWYSGKPQHSVSDKSASSSSSSEESIRIPAKKEVASASSPLPKQFGEIYTAKEINLMQSERVKGTSAQSIAALLGRSVEGVRTKLSRLSRQSSATPSLTDISKPTVGAKRPCPRNLHLQRSEPPPKRPGRRNMLPYTVEEEAELRVALVNAAVATAPREKLDLKVLAGQLYQKFNRTRGAVRLKLASIYQQLKNSVNGDESSENGDGSDCSPGNHREDVEEGRGEDDPSDDPRDEHCAEGRSADTRNGGGGRGSAESGREDRHSQENSNDPNEVGDNDSGDGVEERGDGIHNDHDNGRGKVGNVSEHGEDGSRSDVDSVEETLSGSRSCTQCESSDQE